MIVRMRFSFKVFFLQACYNFQQVGCIYHTLSDCCNLLIRVLAYRFDGFLCFKIFASTIHQLIPVENNV